MAQYYAKATNTIHAYKVGSAPVPTWFTDAIARDMVVPVSNPGVTIKGFTVRKKDIGDEFVAIGDYIINTTTDVDKAQSLTVADATTFDGDFALDNAGLTTVLTKSNDSPDSSVGDSKASPISWAISVANATTTVARANIVVATDATFNLYSDAAFTTEVTGVDTIALTAGTAVAVYIKVTSQNTTEVKYYKVSITRAAT